MKPAWICLPPAILATFMGVLMTPSEAGAKSIKSHVWDEFVTLNLTDGRMIAGRWRGVLGRPDKPAYYPERYERWRGASADAPALGESLVVTPRSGEPVAGVFRGFANHALLLGTADSCVHLVVRLDQGEGVRRAADSTADPHWAAARDRWMTAPSLDAVALQSGSTTIAIPATAISEDWSKPSGTAGWVVLGCVAALVVIVAIGAAAAASTADSIARGVGGTP